ncbi:MAG: imidazole glycerol phosphate synthase subunit HisH [Deltaproteobacteria bacterium]|jgi:glutamine amidotransferase|nr:imidazole glycerol phosphate synthase subunit HisH [Deltaproteobacteria bacterium]
MSADRVAIVDLGLGNLHSVAKAFERAGANPQLSADPDVLLRADRLVMPGQGAFRECAHALRGEVGDAVREWIGSGRPYLGICLGMQALFESSEEAPGEKGLAIFPGKVQRFARDLADAEGNPLKVPHIGWNQIDSKHPVFEDGEWYYFVHSYYCVPADEGLVAATTDYGGPFCSAIARDNVLACQFHPEKSQHAGARVISHFLGDISWS